MPVNYYDDLFNQQQTDTTTKLNTNYDDLFVNQKQNDIPIRNWLKSFYSNSKTRGESNYGIGNIDLNNRPAVKLPDGSVASVYSIGINDNGKEVLIPGVRHGLDRPMTTQEAVDWYKKTGEYLGKFNTIEESNTYAEQLHKDQAKLSQQQDVNKINITPAIHHQYESRKIVNPDIQPTAQNLQLTGLEKVAQSIPVQFLGSLGSGAMRNAAGAVRGAEWVARNAMPYQPPPLPPEIAKQQLSTKNIANLFANKMTEQANKSREMGFKEGTIPQYLTEGLGGAAVSVPIMSLTGIAPYSAVTAAAESESQGGNKLQQLKEGVIGGAIGFVQDKILGGIGKADLKLIPRQLLGGAAMASIPLVEETARKIVGGQDPTKIDWKKVTADFIQGLVFPIGKETKPNTEQQNLVERAQAKATEVPTSSKLEQPIAEEPLKSRQDAPESAENITLRRYTRDANKPLDNRTTSFFDINNMNDVGETPGNLTAISPSKNKFVDINVPKNKIYTGGNAEIDALIKQSPDFVQDTNTRKRDTWTATDRLIAEKLEANGFVGFKYPDNKRLSNEVVILDPTKITKPQGDVVEPEVLFDKKYQRPKNNTTTDGLTIRNHIPNQSSIDASVTNPIYLSGVREIPLSDFPEPPTVNKRTTELANEIKNSGEINPLIVVIDKDGPYILEGANRYDAMKINGAKTIPAQVIIDGDSISEPTRASTAKGKGLSLEELARRQETVLDKNGNVVSIGKLGDEGVNKIYGTDNRAFRPIAGKPGWEEFGKGPTQELTDPALIEKLNIAKPQSDETITPEYSTAEPNQPTLDVTQPPPQQQVINTRSQKIEQLAMEKNLSDHFEELGSHPQMNMGEQIRMGRETVNSDPNQALEMLADEKKIPSNLIGSDGYKLTQESISLALEERAIKTGDVDLLKRLAKTGGQGTTHGQGLRVLAERDPYSPLAALESVNDEVKKSNARRTIETPSIQKVFDNKLKSSETDVAVAQERYRKLLAKKEAQITEKIKTRDYTSVPRNKTPLDAQLQNAKERFDRLSKTFRDLKRMDELRKSGVSTEETQKLLELSKNISQKVSVVTDWNDRSVDGPALEAGRARADFYDYLKELKIRAKERTFAEIKENIKTNPITGTLQELGRGAIKFSGMLKSIWSSMDDSGVGRQGIKILWNQFHPYEYIRHNIFGKGVDYSNTIWFKNSKQSLLDLVHEFGKDTVMREANADLLSRPNKIAGYYDNGKFGTLNIGNVEEAFPEQFHERMTFPVGKQISRAFKASDVAFTVLAQRNRADTADLYINMAKEKGLPLTKELCGGICEYANYLTGRGKLKMNVDTQRVINNFLFSPKFFKSNVDFLITPLKPGQDLFVRKQAAWSLARYAIGTAAVLAISKLWKSDSVEIDPRSADSGKIRIGSTRFDPTGGIGSFATLVTRLGMAVVSSFIQEVGGKPLMATKSSTTGKLSPLTTGKGFRTNGWDILSQFVSGKLSPGASMFKSHLTFMSGNRKPLTYKDELLDIITPLIFKDVIDAIQNKDATNLGLVALADFFGIGVNTYGKGQPKKYKFNPSPNENIPLWNKLTPPTEFEPNYDELFNKK